MSESIETVRRVQAIREVFVAQKDRNAWILFLFLICLSLSASACGKGTVYPDEWGKRSLSEIGIDADHWRRATRSRLSATRFDRALNVRRDESGTYMSVLLGARKDFGKNSQPWDIADVEHLSGADWLGRVAACFAKIGSGLALVFPEHPEWNRLADLSPLQLPENTTFLTEVSGPDLSVWIVSTKDGQILRPLYAFDYRKGILRVRKLKLTDGPDAE